MSVQLVERRETLVVPTYMSDQRGEMLLTSLCAIFSDIAGHHADNLGIGVDALHEKYNMTWMLRRLSIRIDRMPQCAEKIDIQTMPIDTQGLFTHRIYRITLDGANAVSALSEWLMVDLERRRPVRPIAEVVDICNRNPNPDDMPQLTLTDKNLPSDFVDVAEFRACYNDIDFNGHVTQASYIRWITDSLPIAFHADNQLVAAEIFFQHEVMPESQIRVVQNISEDDNGQTMTHKIVSRDGELTHCIARTEWKILPKASN